MVIPFAAGGGFDVMGRILAARMSEILGQQVIIENATGAAGIIGVNRVVNAAPDGYTFLFGSIGTHAYNQTIYKKLRYDAIADFTPVALFAEQPMVLSTRKDFLANNLPEFIDYVKKHNAKLQFGSAGAGTTTHLGCALLNAVIGVHVTHVPYRGGGPAANDLIGGQIDYMCLNMGGAAPLIMGKQIKAVATLSRSRSPLMPDLPTGTFFPFSAKMPRRRVPHVDDAKQRRLGDAASHQCAEDQMAEDIEQRCFPTAFDRRSDRKLGRNHKFPNQIGVYSPQSRDVARKVGHDDVAADGGGDVVE